ncbi:hypothetical protein QAD02_011677 [Eretmocerus hayati]|uniref:Uncharacterized protein n=1 Tax=Eretmocerus hayati TaxID=131215 RepID=A0ACC2NXL0_9HYME|nr:hypothetical protein QAD02_011677 [Eretmocerus hayati]
MNIVDDTDGPLDPRIQIELENLNSATDDINKLEIELDEANTAYGQLLSESTSRLKELMNKLGSNCIEKARCYFEACEVANQARFKCQQQAQLYQRANVIHAAAKETVALAEARFMSHQHEWNFDQAWQDMLNHATLKVMDAETQKAECAREHQRRTLLFHEAEKKVQQLEEKYRRSINRAQPYFDLKAYCDQKLAVQKERVDCLKRAVKDAKFSYAASLRALEEISNQIHEKRRDYDIVANGPREPGVGAELVTPDESLDYLEALNKVRISRVNSIASSDQDLDDRSQDFEDVRELKNRVDHLSSRSVDGSESTSSQWELELQASVEKLNNLPIEDCGSSKTNIVNSHEDGKSQVTVSDKESSGPAFSNESSKDGRRKQFDDFYQGWQSLTQSPINIINRSKIALKNSISKSLSNSPVTMGTFSFGKPKAQQSEPDEPGTCEEESRDLKQEILTNQQVSRANETDAEKYSASVGSAAENRLVSSKSSNELVSENSMKRVEQSQIHPRDYREQKVALSLNSTPVRVKSLSSSPSADSIANRTTHSCKTEQTHDSKSNFSSSKAKELPLLSFFQKSSALMPSKDRSCSMVDLNSKQNLKTLLDRSDLGNIQAASIEKLANARHKLVGDR